MKQLLRFSFLLLALLLPAIATAYDFEVDGIYYDIDGTNASVTFGNNEYTGSVTIPATVTYNGTTYPVTAIGLLAFRYSTGLTSIDIPNSVTKIDDFAFEGCTGLTSIGIPNSVTSIGFNAFYNTGWFNNQPDGLVYAGMVAYRYKGTMPNGTSIYLKEGTLGIANSAFRYCTGLTSIVIPNSVIEIGEEAFNGCTGLTGIDIPNSVTEIGEDAFYDTAWYDNQPDGLVYAGKVAYKYKGTMPSGTSITLREGTVGITRSAFEECTGLTSIVIPNSVTHIGSGAFSFCTGLTSIVIPNSVTKIGSWAFGRCTGLTSIVIPNSVTSIGFNAFYYCTSLTSIVIPNSVTEIGYEAFSGCTGVTDVYSYITDPTRIWGGYDNPCKWWYLFDGEYSGRTLHVLQGTADAYRADANWYPYFGRIVEDIFLGDVNRDLEVNIADVNAVIDMILGGNDDTTAADVNGDGEINIADVNGLIDLILN